MILTLLKWHNSSTNRKVIMKTLMAFFFIVLLTVACNGQPKQFHTFGNAVPDADYYLIFIWEGTDINDCPLQAGVETLTQEILDLQVDSLTTIDHYYQINLSGQTIRCAVVAFNTLDQSPMGVTAFHVVPMELAEPVIQAEIL